MEDTEEDSESRDESDSDDDDEDDRDEESESLWAVSLALGLLCRPFCCSSDSGLMVSSLSK